MGDGFTPAPSMRNATGVPARRGNPWERRAPPIGVGREIRLRVADDRRKRVADAVAESELQLADRGHQQHVPDLVPDPARIGSDAERLGWRTVLAVPRLARATRQVAQG